MRGFVVSCILLTAAIMPPVVRSGKSIETLIKEYTIAFFNFRGYSKTSPPFSTEMVNVQERIQFAARHNASQEKERASLWDKTLDVKKQEGFPTQFCTGSVKVDDKHYNNIYAETVQGPSGDEQGIAPTTVLTTLEVSQLGPIAGVLDSIIAVAKGEGAKMLGCNAAEIFLQMQPFEGPLVTDGVASATETSKYVYFIMAKGP